MRNVAAQVSKMEIWNAKGMKDAKRKAADEDARIRQYEQQQVAEEAKHAADKAAEAALAKSSIAEVSKPRPNMSRKLHSYMLIINLQRQVQGRGD